MTGQARRRLVMIPATGLGAAAVMVSALITEWRARDLPAAHRPADRHPRQAASEAVSAINALISDLHVARAELVAEVRAYDEAARRADALIADTEHRRSGDTPTDPR